MIWEVDDDCDKHVTWAEFQAMFSRCRNDKTGAPRRCWACMRSCAGGVLFFPRLSRLGGVQVTSRAGCTTLPSF
jgi:hypothetical protein